MVQIKVFHSTPPCGKCIKTKEMAERLAKEHPGKLELIKLIGEEATAKFEEYKLGCVPAIVINEKIIIEGICPSQTTLANALREGGL